MHKLTKLVCYHIGWSLALLMIAEMACRFIFTSPSRQTPDSVIGFRYIPNTKIFYGNEGGAWIKLNELGLNSPPINEIKNHETYLFLGDSFVEALHVPTDQNFSAITENLIYPVKIINAGRSDASPLLCTEIHRRICQYVKPTRVVLFLNEGDLTDLDRDRGLTSPSGQLEIEPVIQRRSKNLLAPILNKSSLITHLSRKASLAFATKNPDIQKDSSADNSNDVRGHRLKLLVAAINYLSTHQPTEIVFLPQIEYRSHRRASVTVKSKECWILIQDACRQAGIRPTSLEEPFIQYYLEHGKAAHGFNNRKIGIGHLNQIGHRLTAMSLAEKLAAK